MKISDVGQLERLETNSQRIIAGMRTEHLAQSLAPLEGCMITNGPIGCAVKHPITTRTTCRAASRSRVGERAVILIRQEE